MNSNYRAMRKYPPVKILGMMEIERVASHLSSTTFSLLKRGRSLGDMIFTGNFSLGFLGKSMAGEKEGW